MIIYGRGGEFLPKEYLIFAAGEIRVLVEQNNELRPLIQATHTNPIKVQYLAFSSYQNSKSEFYFNCPGDVCRQHVAFLPSYDQMYPITDLTNGQPTGFHFSMPVYLKGDRDAQIILSSSSNPNDTLGNAYEIGIIGIAFLTFFFSSLSFSSLFLPLSFYMCELIEF